MRFAAVTVLIAAVAMAMYWSVLRTDPTPASVVAAPGASPGAESRSSDATATRRELVTPPATEPDPTPAASVELKVVDWATGAAVAGADLWWLRAAERGRVDGLPDVDRARYADDDELMVRTFGRHARADARAVARIDVDQERTRVVARSADRVGRADVTLQDAERGAILEISRELAVALCAVDPVGRPVVGVPIQCNCSSWGLGPRPTDASGVARFDYLEEWVSRDERGAPRRIDATLRACVPGLEDLAVSFPATAPPAEMLTLVLPPIGALHVHVSHPGREIESASARLWIGDPDDRTARNAAWQRDADRDGVIRYDVVPLAATFVVELEIGDLLLPRRVAGPSRAGELVDATIEVPADAIALVGRLLDADGRPVASEDVWLRCNLPRGKARHWLHTDEHGRFLWHPGATGPGGRELSEFALLLRRGTFDDDVAATVSPRALQPGVNDLGDVVLDRSPLVVAGRFHFEPPRSPHAVSFVIERWIDVAQPGNAGGWQEVEESLFSSQDEGRFVVRGALAPGRLRIRCVRDGEPVEFGLGAQGLVVETAPSRR